LTHDPRISARKALRRIIDRSDAEGTLLPHVGRQAIDVIDDLEDLDDLLRMQGIFLKGKR
jgi:hypothetical protein